ncbi:Arginine metabolism regulation II-like protein [Cladobotryum mycophilum]|uniref:Arginine metabolism regulation II-like protein n=1 Tax=Cladobotryum mycophilum TaxID=491253 RepID=A0ABR0SJN7_9HYPO
MVVAETFLAPKWRILDHVIRRDRFRDQFPFLTNPFPSSGVPNNGSGMASKTVRTRTFTGCRTCRSRRAKCDEAQPVCGSCKRLGIECEGYAGSLVWVTRGKAAAFDAKSQQSHRGEVYRQLLYSESERRRMTLCLVESLGKQTAENAIADLDTGSCEKEDKDGVSDAFLAKGPFGVFRLGKDEKKKKPSSGPCTSVCTLRDAAAKAAEVVTGGMGATDEGIIDDSILNSLDFSSSSNDQDGDVTTQATDQDLIRLPSLSTPSTNGLTDMTLGDMLDMNAALFGTEGMQEDSAAIFDRFPMHSMNLQSPPLTRLPRPTGYPKLPENAEPLLRYYKQHVLEHGLMLQAKQKSPWKIMFFPCALQTFAELHLWSSTSHTRAAILYALLANSAFQLHNSQPLGNVWPTWFETASKYQEIAKKHLRYALQTELLGPRQAKYKQLLMAVLSVAMISLFQGAEKFKGFLLDAERLIRLRGLGKQMSLKVRILHHMYSHLRIIAEATCTICDYVKDFSGFSQSPFAPAVAPKFAIDENALNTGLDPEQEKIKNVGYSDIHLEVQGRWDESLFSDMYGIPESLMTLLSQVISLANTKSRLESVAGANAQILEALTRHATTLEQSIWTWTAPPGVAGYDASGNTRVLAMHQALIIYFYRRVHNTHAMFLQDQVKQTLDYIQTYIEQEVFDQDFVISVAWSAYMAACGAVGLDVQKRALDYMATLQRRGVFITGEPVHHITGFWRLREVT